MKTDKSMIGCKVIIVREGREILATIERLDSSYPQSAYTVTWTRADNPSEIMHTESAYSIVHCSQVKRVA